jgi:hypothetical protein
VYFEQEISNEKEKHTNASGIYHHDTRHCTGVSLFLWNTHPHNHTYSKDYTNTDINGDINAYGYTNAVTNGDINAYGYRHAVTYASTHNYANPGTRYYCTQGEFYLPG